MEIRDRVNKKFPEKNNDFPLSIKGTLGINYQFNRDFLSENDGLQLYIEINQYLEQKLHEIKRSIEQVSGKNPKHNSDLSNNNNLESNHNASLEFKASTILIKSQRTIKSPHLGYQTSDDEETTTPRIITNQSFDKKAT